MTLKNDRKIVYLAGFLFSIHLALTSYVNSSFLQSYVSENYVGLVYVLASIVTIIGLLEMPRLLRRTGNRYATLIFSLICLVSLLALSVLNQKIPVILAFIAYFASGNFIIATLDIFVEEFSKDKNIGKLRGLFLVVANSAWVVAQMVSGTIIDKSSYKGIYVFAAVFMALVAGIFIMFLKDFKDPVYKKVPVLKTLSFFRQDKNISRIYFINFILKFFFAWMVIYTPIFLHEHIGFTWDKIGLIFTIMLLPFVILEFPLGKLSDKIGEKKMLLSGFLITAFFALMIPFIKGADLILWAIILFGTRVGAAIIEVMSESYFFKVVNSERADAISFFRNTYPLSYIIAPLLAVPILFLIPSFEYLFFILGAVMFCGFLITLRLKDVK